MKKLLLVVLLLSAARGRAPAQEQDNDDVQLWPDVTIGFRVNPNVTLGLFGTLRFGQNVSARITHQVGASVNFRVNDYLDIVPHYRQAWSYPTPTRRSEEHRYFVDVTPRLPLPKGFLVLDRNRSERRDIHEQTSWRYRNRIQLEKALTWREPVLTLYVAEEFHYDSRFHEWNRRQFWAGTRIPVTKYFTLDFHYARNSDARARPGTWHIIGVFSRFEF
jgi:hypothetical protein